MSAKFLLTITKHKNFTINLQQKIMKLQQSRLQSTATLPAANSGNYSLEEEWAKAKPFKEIPSGNGLKSILSFLPGGKYYKMPPADLLRCLKQDIGNILRFDGYFGRKNVVLTYNVDDFVTVLRNEGIWPERPSLRGQEYHRSVYRGDFFKGVEGVITTQGEKWANFRSAVNPVLMKPKNVRLYLHKMSEVNKEFVERIICYWPLQLLQ